MGKRKWPCLQTAKIVLIELAKYLLSFGMTEYRAFVAENLQGETEKSGWYELDEMIGAGIFSLKCRHFEKKIRRSKLVLGDRR